MHSIPQRHHRRTDFQNLPLFAWAEARQRWQPVPAIVRHVARRAQCSLARARVIAELIGPEARS